MTNGEVTSSSIDETSSTNGGNITWKDIKSLIKIGIVNSNLFTVFAGYWLALYFTGVSFMPNIKVFFLTMVGSTLVLIGASILNNWYDADVDQAMERTEKDRL